MLEKPAVHNDGRILKAYLLGIRRREFKPAEAAEHLGELASLVETMGLEMVGSEVAPALTISPKYLIGSGKADMIKAACEGRDADLLIVDDELSPAQQRNWEKLTGIAVIDRREVILDIFAQRAQTHEARLQVQLARLEYSLPRLKRAWTHLERQRGGGGFIGGAGEAQIEIDRRLVRDEIAKLKRDLVTVRRQRETQRKGRGRRPFPTAALVGYTNSGKSSLLNRLTRAGVLAEDKLFATLDPTTRRVDLPNNQVLLLTDTVGFIRKLPHMLVEAFMATLEEARVSDFLIHVVDASHPNAMDHVKVTLEVLKELGTDDRPMLFLLNKIDAVEDRMALANLRSIAEPNVLISAKTGEGVDDFMARLADFAARGMGLLHVGIPHDRSDLVSFLHREGQVLSEKYGNDTVEVEARLAMKHHPRFEPYRLEPASG